MLRNVWIIVVVKGIFVIILLTFSQYFIDLKFFFLSMFTFLKQKNELLLNLTGLGQWNEAFVNFELNDVDMNAARLLFIVQPSMEQNWHKCCWMQMPMSMPKMYVRLNEWNMNVEWWKCHWEYCLCNAYFVCIERWNVCVIEWLLDTSV